MDNFGVSIEKGIEDLGWCVNPAQSSLPNVTSGISIVRHIESVVGEWAGCARNSREYHPESAEKRLLVWRKEMLAMLRVFDVRGQ